MDPGALLNDAYKEYEVSVGDLVHSVSLHA